MIKISELARPVIAIFGEFRIDLFLSEDIHLLPGDTYIE